MTGRRIAVLIIFVLCVLSISMPSVLGATLYGPQELTISRWHSHLSRHTFASESAGDGVIEVVKSTPQHDIRGGFIFFNKKLIGLRRFLTGDDPTFAKDVSLKTTNSLIIFVRGTPGASVSLTVRRKDSLKPEIMMFTATPALVKIGESSTLTWQTKNAATCEIDSIGMVDLNGSTTVEPAMPTTYKLTAGNFEHTVTATVSIAIENSAPVAIAQELTTAEDTAVSIVLAGSDPDNDPLSFEVYSQPLYGTLTGDAPTLAYTPDLNFDKTDSFEFIVNDGEVDSEPALVAITVTPVNDAPTTEEQNLDLNEDQPFPLVLKAADVDGDALAYEIIRQPANGSLDGSPPDMIYRPTANYNGPDSLEFRVNDGTVNSEPAIITFTIAPVNDAPQAAEDKANTGEDNPVDINVLANDSDVDGDVLSISDFTQPLQGMVQDNGNGTLTYTPYLNYFGTDSFSYTLSDGNGDFDTALVTVTVLPINDAPRATPQSHELAEDEPFSLVLTGQDADNDLLTYVISEGPSNGTLTGKTPDLTYTPNPDYHGPDAFSFTVSDGSLTSIPAEVSLYINGKNDAPVADAGPDQTVTRLDTVVLNGNGSGDVDDDTLSFQWTWKLKPAGSTAVFSDPSQPGPGFVADLAGVYEIELMVSDGQLDSVPDTVTITATPRQVTVPNVLNMARPAAESDILAADLVVGAMTTDHSADVPADYVIGQNPAAGNTAAEGTAIDLVISLGPDIQPPTASISASPAEIPQGLSSILTWNSENAHSVHIDNGIGSVDVAGSLEVFPEHTTTYIIVAVGAYGNTSARVTVKVSAMPDPQPEGSYGEQYEDLIPPDASVEKYDPQRFSLITGLVTDAEGTALAGVAITLLNHLEYGTVTTDGQGVFTIPVEGGGTMSVVYQKEGYIPVQRKIYVPWNDIAVADAVSMIIEDPAATTLTFDDNPQTVVTHRSTEVRSDSGTRALSMVFTGDNQAWLVDEQGNDVQQLDTITVRATEYETPESMPAMLPPTSAFTYCAELTVDGIERVRFGKPVVIWVDNFLGVAVGEIVPVGYFDRDQGVWVPEENGLVVKLLDTDSDGVTDALDSDGDGQPNDLNGNGSFSDEVQGLDDNSRYIPGTTFWRSEINHFSPVDLNYPFWMDPDAIEPNPNGPRRADQKNSGEKDSPTCLGSFVEQKSRIFHEDIPIAGTSVTLHYDSSRVAGYKPGIITIPASGDSVPDSLLRIIVKVSVAGRAYEVELPAEPNQMAEIIWDGLDHLGRPVTGSVIAHIRIGFVYDGFYWVPGNLARAFGQPGTRSLSLQTRISIVLWKDAEIPIIRGKGTIAEGWSISAHHHLSPMDPFILFKGDGTINRNNASIIDTYAGNGSGSGYFSGMGGPATQAQIPTPSSLAMDSQGNVYIFSSHLANWQSWQSRILKVDPQGIVTEFFSGISFNSYGGYIATDPQGNLYYSGYIVWGGGKGDGGCVRKVTPQGIQTDVIGTCGEGSLRYSGIHVDNQGNIYAAIKSHHKVVKRDPSGIVTVVAGSGSPGSLGDGGFAVNAQLNSPEGVFVDDKGNLYISHLQRVRKVDAGGNITTVAGGGSGNASGDGGPATDVYLPYIGPVTMDTAGNLYITDQWRRSIRRVDTKGIISTVAGINYIPSTGYGEYSGDGRAATNAKMAVPTDVLLDLDGNILIADLYNNRIRKVSPPAPSLKQVMEPTDLAFTEDSGIGFIMSSAGRHKKTIDLDTAVILYEFGYDEENNLISITDQFDNRITVDWENGVPTAIISPDGIKTGLTVDPATRHLTRITYADETSTEFEYSTDGLLTVKTEPEQNQFGHVYDENGRLIEFDDDEGGLWQFSRTVFDNGKVRNEVVSREENKTIFLDYTDSTGAYESTTIAPTDDESYFSHSSDGLTATSSLPCGMQQDFTYDVDGEYKFKYLKELRERTPAGLQKVWSRTKSYQDSDSDGITDLFTDEITVNGKITRFENNTLEARRSIKSPEGRLTIVDYDPATLQTDRLSIAGLHDTEYGYDTKGRLTLIKRSTRQTAIAYDTKGFLESVTDGEAKTTVYGHDDVGRLTSITRPDNGLVDFTYDDNGNLTVLTIQAKVDHGFDYNRVNNNDAYHTPQSGSYRFSYNYDRELTAVTFPSQKQILYNYEKTLLKQVLTPEDTIDFSYLCGGKVRTATNGTEAVTYGYDGRLLTSESLTGTLNQALSYRYNNDFNLNSFTYAGKTFNYTFDNDNLLTGAGAFTITRRSDNGLPEKVSDGNWNLSRGFNLFGEVSSQSAGIGEQAVAAFSYDRDNNGRITEKSEAVDGITTLYRYEYDDTGRLLKVFKNGELVEEYRYNPNGTRSFEMNATRGTGERTFEYSDEDHLLTAGDTTYQYDLDGFLTTKNIGSDVTTYVYSQRGELLKVELPEGRVIEYIHDPLGRRIAKKVDGAIVEKYLWQGRTRLLAVFDGTDHLLMRFEYADDRMPISMTKEGVAYYLIFDQIGSLRFIADGVGNVVKRIDYDSFGNITADSNEGFKTLFGFSGGLHDLDTGLVRFGYRDYDPDIGRWTAKDPIFFEGGGMDLYGYVLNDPINWIDPWGLRYGGPHGWQIFSEDLSATGGPPPGIGPVPVPWSEYKEAIKDNVVEPLDEAVNSIPPGTTTGNPYWDIWMNIYQMLRGLDDLFENEEKKEKECDQ